MNFDVSDRSQSSRHIPCAVHPIPRRITVARTAHGVCLLLLSDTSTLNHLTPASTRVRFVIHRLKSEAALVESGPLAARDSPTQSDRASGNTQPTNHLEYDADNLSTIREGDPIANKWADSNDDEQREVLGPQ